MIILRRTIIDKLFSDRSTEINQIIVAEHTYVKEIMKAIELYWDDPNDVSHWIDKAGGYIFKDTFNKSYINPHYCFLSCLEDSEIISLVGANSLSIIRSKYRTSEDFIESVKIEILTERGGKYRTWIKNISDFKFTNIDYVNIFKFISLCISGAIDPSMWFNINSWENIKLTNKPYSKLTNVNQLKDLIHSCIENILGIR